MRIAIGSDHAGFELKQHLGAVLAAQGHDVKDLGTDGPDSCDYPDYAASVAHEVAQGRADRGILVCTTGMGMTMAANKIKGIRAALAVNPDEVLLTRKHNNANILAFSSRYTKPDEAGARLLVERMAVLLGVSLAVRYSPAAVADAAVALLHRPADLIHRQVVGQVQEDLEDGLPLGGLLKALPLDVLA